jgi:hypothetical protein
VFLTCFLGDSCCSEDKQSKNFEPEFVLSEVVLKLQNQSSVQVFSSPIKVKRKHDGNVQFSQDQDPNNKKGEMLSDFLMCSSESIAFFSQHRGLCITVFDPGGVVVKPLSVAKVLDDYGEILRREPQSHDEGKTDRAIIVFDPGGKFDLCNFWYSSHFDVFFGVLRFPSFNIMVLGVSIHCICIRIYVYTSCNDDLWTW